MADALRVTALMTESQAPDQQLLREIGAGNEASFRELYTRYQGVLFRFALHMTGSVAAAEDITQDVFIQLISKPASYDPGKGSVAAYLFGIARNLARSSLKRSRANVALYELTETELGLASDAELVEHLSSPEALDTLRMALLTLPEVYREVIVLCDLEEMSYANAAAVLDCSAGTIASRLHRAHHILRAKLGAMATRTAD